VLVGTLRPADGQPGRKITYDAGAFALEGHGAVGTDDVIEYDRQGRLEWADEGTRAWALSRGQATPRAGRAPASRTDLGPPSNGGRIRWAIVAPVVVAAVVAVVFVVALSRQAGTTEREPWPAMFEGTWQYDHTSKGLPSIDGFQMIFTRSAGEAIIRVASHPDSGVDFAFDGQALTVTRDGDGQPEIYRRTAFDGADFVGRYDSTRQPGVASYDHSYRLDYDGDVLKLTISVHDAEPEWLTFRLSEDRRMMFMQSGGSGIPAIDVFTKVDAVVVD
jgi:hypothetical protein